MRSLFFATVAATFILFSCQENKQTPKKMTGLAGSLQDSSIVRIWPLEMDTLKLSNPNIPIVDVRTELEFHTSHIYRSMNCDVSDSNFAQRIQRLDKNSPVIVYDESSSRSLQAAEIMKQLGFVRVYEIAGGIGSWAREGKTLVAGESKIDSNIVLK